MSGRIQSGVAVCLAAVAAIAAWQWQHASGPAYQGRSLGARLEGYSAPLPAVSGFQFGGANRIPLQRAATGAAVRAIGTNAIPSLLRMLRATDSAMWLKCVTFLEHLRIVKVKFTRAAEWNERARFAFEALGTRAGNAVLQLIEIYQQNRSSSSRKQTLLALAALAPAADRAVRALISALKDSNPTERFDAILTLASIHSRSDLVVPALVKCLTDTNGAVRMAAPGALCYPFRRPELAISALRAMLNDPDAVIRDLATNALKRIDPGVAAKDGLR